MQPFALIVEDNHALSDAIALVIGDIVGIKYDRLNDGRRVMEYLSTHQPDLLLLDLHLPIVSGRMILEELNRLDTHPNMRVIVLTADILMGQKVLEEFSCIDRFIPKPFSMRELSAVVRELLKIELV